MSIIALALSILAGGFATVNNGYTVKLSRKLEEIGAAWVFLATSLFFTCLLLLGKPPALQEIVWRRIPWYLWSSGFINFLAMAVNIWVVRHLGMSVSTSITLLWQMFFSLIFDHYGFLGISCIPFSFSRLIGLGALFIGCLFVTGAKMESLKKLNLKYLTGAIFVGFSIAFTGALNVKLESYVGLVGSTINYFLPGTLMLAVVSPCTMRKISRKLGKQPKYLYLVGFFNTCLILVQTWAIPLLGMGIFFTLLFLGQMALALWADIHGWWEMPKLLLGIKHILGFILMLLGLPLLYVGV